MCCRVIFWSNVCLFICYTLVQVFLFAFKNIVLPAERRGFFNPPPPKKKLFMRQRPVQLCYAACLDQFLTCTRTWVHQNRASPFASDFYRRRGYRREFRSEDHVCPFSSQNKSHFASDFLRRVNRAPWGFKKSRDFSGSGKKRRRNRTESRDFGALRRGPVLNFLFLGWNSYSCSVF